MFLQVFNQLRSELTTETARENRRFIYENQILSLRSLTPPDLEKVESVCVLFDHIGVLLHLDYIDEELFFSQFYDVVIKCWRQLEDAIEGERRRKFQRLYEHAISYAEKNKFLIVEVHPRE